MRALADALLAALFLCLVIVVAGGSVAAFVSAVAWPLAGVLAAAILARLVWFYTSRW